MHCPEAAHGLGAFPPKKMYKTIFPPYKASFSCFQFLKCKGTDVKEHTRHLSSGEHSSPHTHFLIAFSFFLSLRHLTMSLQDHKLPCAAAKDQPLHLKPELTASLSQCPHKQSGRKVLSTSNNNTFFIKLTPSETISEKPEG